MKKEIIKEIIRDFHKGVLPFTNKRDVVIPFNTGKIITLSGVRRSGKTFILFETIKALLSKNIAAEKIFYINFEDERFDLVKDDLDLIIQAYRELYPDTHLNECYFFFDEIQNVNGWEKFARRAYDAVTKNLFITGSNSRLLSKEIASSLRGRTVTYEVFPLSFSEYLRFNSVEIDLYHSRTRAKIINLFEKFLFEGGFPEITGIEDVSLKQKVLQEYFNVMLYRDLVERFNITGIHVLKFFIKRLFENITSTVSVNKIYNELKSHGYKIGKNSLYEYLDAAESIYLFLMLKKSSESVLKQELSEKKPYVIDNGLLNAVTFRFSHDYGRLLENALFLELFRRKNNIFFYKNKKECDFLINDKSGIKMIQASYSIADGITRKRELEGIIEACKRFGSRKGYIITMSEEEEIKEAGVSIKVIPAFKFFLTEKLD